MPIGIATNEAMAATPATMASPRGKFQISAGATPTLMTTTIAAIVAIVAKIFFIVAAVFSAISTIFYPFSNFFLLCIVKLSVQGLFFFLIITYYTSVMGAISQLAPKKTM
jgi:hypothetical protein